MSWIRNRNLKARPGEVTHHTEKTRMFAIKHAYRSFSILQNQKINHYTICFKGVVALNAIEVFNVIPKLCYMV